MGAHGPPTIRRNKNNGKHPRGGQPSYRQQRATHKQGLPEAWPSLMARVGKGTTQDILTAGDATKKIARHTLTFGIRVGNFPTQQIPHGGSLHEKSRKAKQRKREAAQHAQKNGDAGHAEDKTTPHGQTGTNKHGQ